MEKSLFVILNKYMFESKALDIAQGDYITFQSIELNKSDNSNLEYGLPVCMHVHIATQLYQYMFIICY